jgi:hypothetical protein
MGDAGWPRDGVADGGAQEEERGYRIGLMGRSMGGKVNF